ncbi:MAG: nucleotidyltransferase family protein [Chloroflexi bacterium]|nr:nucleotidyltransferase family protein [Chloroflexota bacterium]MBU1746284.1 nucleotidyltransferase family protein [Chloroflexota bacterium]
MIAVVVLAAGSSQRMGQPKQLLSWPPGAFTTLLGHAVEVAWASAADQVVVVLGYQADAIMNQVLSLTRSSVRVVVNKEWRTGQASSLRAGVESATRDDAEAVVFVPCDQPGITPGLLNRVMAAYRTSGQPIVVPRYKDRRGPPVLFARPLFPALLRLAGDQGGRSLFDAYPDQIAWVDTRNDAWLVDVDTLADYEALRDGR